MYPKMPIRKDTFVPSNRYNKGVIGVNNLYARWRRMAIYRFNVSVNNLFGEDIRRKDSGKYCGLIGLQRWCTSLMHDKVANKTR